MRIANLKGNIDSVIENCDTVVVNRGNRTGVVMMSPEEYNSLKETEYIMSSEQLMNDIRKGEEDLKAGKGIEVNLENTKYHNTGLGSYPHNTVSPFCKEACTSINL